jgi:AmmeMemoRadiSam system protein B
VPNPRIRLIEPIPIHHEGQEVILLRDAEGVTEEHLIVSREAAYMIFLMDGTRSLRDIQAEFMRASGQLIFVEKIEEVVRTLDDHCLLRNERFDRHMAGLRSSYENGAVRPPFLAGKSYPANRMDLLVYLDEAFRKAPTPDNVPGEITGILAPHIDYERGMKAYLAVYPYLKSVKKPLIVILGTCHRHTEKLLSISLKNWSTPLDEVPVSPEVARLVREDPVLAPYIDEWPHRTEHSIELQLPLLQFAVQDDFEILPILTGSMHEFVEGTRTLPDAEIEDLVSALKALLSRIDRPAVIIAAADLAHIGAQFGDSFTCDRFTLEESKTCDERMLDPVKDGDAGSFLRFIAAEKDRRRICGLTPIYFQLRLLEGSRCTMTAYEQWTDGQSSVSFAGAVFYR